MTSNFPTRIILCGSGNSVREGIEIGLHDILNYEYTIGINEWYRFVSIPTVVGFVDIPWYKESFDYIGELPLIVGAKHGEFKEENIHDNTILLPFSNKLHLGKSWEKGFYSTALCGIFMLTLSIELGFTEIYLLGFDGCEIDGKTHFYQDLINIDEKNNIGKTKWRGVGKEKINHHNVKKGEYKGRHYNNIEKLNSYFDVYKDVADKVKVYNVSPKSVIDSFEKISYRKFFKKIKGYNEKISQVRAREQIKEMILERKK